MALVHNKDIPGLRLRHATEVLSVDGTMDTRDNSRVGGQSRIRLYRSPLAKTKTQSLKLTTHVVYQTCRREIEYSQAWLKFEQLLDDEPHFHGLSKSDFIGNQDFAEVLVFKNVAN